MIRYAIEAEAREDELLDLLSEEQKDLLGAWLSDNWDEGLASFISTPSAAVQKCVGQTPANDRQWAAKTPRPRFLREWLAARYWAIAAARALRIAAELHDVPALGYRPAAQTAVPVAERWLAPPTAADLLSLRMVLP